MKVAMALMIRMMGVMGLALCGLAVWMGHTVPETPLRQMDQRQFVFLKRSLQNVSDQTSQMVDGDTGLVQRLNLPPKERLEDASLSPWRDESGEYHVVGRWSRLAGEGWGVTSSNFGLARLSYPSGEVLDRLETEILPVGAPCWLPGTTARVLFASSDGVLYHYSFEGHEPALTSEKSVDEDVPQPVSWSCPPPGRGKVFFSNPTWSKDDRLIDKVILTASVRERDRNGEISYSASQLWWLQMDLNGRTVRAAGRLTFQDEVDGREINDRYPTVVAVPGKDPSLVFLREVQGESLWKICVCPLRIDPEDGTLTIEADEIRVLATDSIPNTPAVSTDGNWVTYMVQGASGQVRPHRIALESPIELNQELPTLALSETLPRIAPNGSISPAESTALMPRRRRPRGM